MRVNPDVEAGLHPYLRTGHDQAKFGLPVGAAVELYRRVVAGDYPNLDPVGVHVHVGSQLAGPGDPATGARVAPGVLEAGRRFGLPLHRVDVGGGLPVDYDGGPVSPPEEFAAALTSLVAGAGGELKVEPGRSLVAKILAVTSLPVLIRRYGVDAVLDAHNLARARGRLAVRRPA